MTDAEARNRFGVDPKDPDPWITLAVFLLAVYLLAVSLPSPGAEMSIPGEDEGFRLYVTWRVSVGELPYRDFFDNQLPNLHLLAAPMVSGLGRRVDAPRFFVLGFYVLLAVSFLGLARRRGRRMPAGGLAAAMLLLIPLFRRAVTHFRPDVPALSVGMMAVVGGLVPARKADPGRGEKILVTASGFLFGLACFIKPTPLYWLPGLIVGAWLVDRGGDRSAHGIRFGGGMAAALLIQAAAWHGVSGGDVWDQVVTAHRVPVPSTPLRTVLGEWAFQNAWLLPGLVLWGFTERGTTSRTLLLAGGGGLLMYGLVPPNTPYPRHLLFVSVAWAYPAAVGYAQGWRRGTEAAGRTGRWLIHLSAGILMAVAAAGVGSAGSHDGSVLREAEWIRTHTDPGDVVLTDYGGLNYLAGRSRPPALANTSANLTMGGVITADRVRTALEGSRPAMIYLHVHPGAWHLANVRGMDSVVAAWFDEYRYRGLRVVDGNVNMVFTADETPVSGLRRDPDGSLSLLEPIFSTYGWDRTLGRLRERVSG